MDTGSWPWTYAKRPSFSLRVRKGVRASITFLGHIEEGGMGKQDMALTGGMGGRLAAETTSRPRTRVTVLAEEEGFSLLGLFI